MKIVDLLKVDSTYGSYNLFSFFFLMYYNLTSNEQKEVWRSGMESREDPAVQKSRTRRHPGVQ